MKKIDPQLFFSFVGLLLLIACSSAQPANQEPAGRAADTATVALTEEPSPTPTEEPGAPGKLLNPCALMPADEVESLFGSEIRGDYRRSIIVPTTSGSIASNGTEVERERALYECYYLMGVSFIQKISLMIEIFENADDARAELEASQTYYHGILEAQGSHPMDEISDLGDKAYSFVPNSADELPGPDFSSQYFHIPIVHFVSGHYLVSVIVDPFAETADQNNAYYEKALQFARNAQANLPENIHSAMADQDYHLDEPWQPVGKTTEPCELITPDEAQSYLDKPIIYEQSNSDWGLVYGGIGYGDELHPFLTLICTYTTLKTIPWSPQGVSNFDGIIIELAQTTVEEWNLYVTHNQGRLTEVGGVGDEAFRNATGDYIVILQGNMWISVRVPDTDDTNSQFQATLEIAQLILDRFH